MDLLLCYASSDEESSHDDEERQSSGNYVSDKDGSPQPPVSSSSAPKEQESPTGASPKHQQIPTATSPSRKRPRTTTATSLNSDRSIEIVTDCSSFLREEPHVRGNWSGHVFVKVGGKGLEHQASRSVEAFKHVLEARTHFSGQIYRHNPLHLSLSRPFYLQESNIDSFVALLKERLQFQCSFAVSLSFQSQDGSCLVNDDQTRSFWVWPILAATNDELTTLVGHIDAVLQLYRQPTYYHPPLFHVSVASIPEAVPDRQSLVKVEEKDGEAVDGNLGSAILPVNEIVCTFGSTKEFVIPLL